ncbi:DUF4421 family protein [Flavobacterium adhaerens]|uniref:DUF4421 family protein n=1 Tax=Flavobacterium adhaerens TaxID=3149043 RepID=UPI0032B32EA6
MKTILKSFFPNVFLLFFINVSILFGQNKKAIDTSNIHFYPEKIMIRANLSTQSDAQILQSKNGDNLDLETNNSYKLFLSVDYKFIGFSYGFYPKFIGGNNDESTKGKSKFSEYNFRFFLGKWIQTVDYSKIRGYYVENTGFFLPDWNPNEDPYFQFPNLKTVKYGMSTSYVFNPKYSLKSVTSFTEWQKESAGSFIPTLIYDYKKFSVETDFLNSKQNEYDIYLGVGYFYNCIIRKNFYIAPNLTFATGIKITNSESFQSGMQSSNRDNYWVYNLVGGLKMGYNSEHILFGLSFNFDNTSYDDKDHEIISNDKAFGLIYFGYRFGAPKYISKPVNKVNDLLKL